MQTPAGVHSGSVIMSGLNSSLAQSTGRWRVAVVQANWRTLCLWTWREIDELRWC